MTMMKTTVPALLLAAWFPAGAMADAMEECDKGDDRAAVAACLGSLESDAQAALKRSEMAAGKAAREVEVATKRPGAYTAFASAARAFALYTQAHCDYVRAMQPDAGAPPGAVPSAADVARLACRVDLTRERIDDLK